MKRSIVIIILLFLINTLTAQKLTKEEKKQRKSDLKSLIENIDESEISYEDSKKMDKLEFLNKSSEYIDDIKLINEYKLHKFMPFIDIYKKGKKFYIYKRGLGKTYPNEKNMNEYIQSEEIINIYNFDKPENINDPKCLVFEYKSHLDKSKLQYAAIELSDYTNRMIYLRKQIILLKHIQNEEFNISVNTCYGISTDQCFPYAFNRNDFIVVSSKLESNKLEETAYTYFESKEDSILKKTHKYLSKASKINMDYWRINFELDSIKYYSLDVVSLLNSGILKDSIRSYGKRRPFETSSIRKFYYDLNERITWDNVDNENMLDLYTSTELEERSDSDYWEEVVPKGNELNKFLSQEYITLPMSISADLYEKNNKINGSEFYFSTFKFDNYRFDICNNKYCYACKEGISIPCAANHQGKQYDSRKYLYSSIDPEIMREQLINSLTKMFCQRSGSMNTAKKKKEKEEKYKNDLAKKYGIKYVEAALEGDIIIGMPEDLLTIPLRAWNIDSNTEWENGYLIYYKFKFDTSKRIKIIVRKGKVTEISKW